MPGCVVKWCRSYNRLKCPGITFHYFPADPIRQNKWTAAVKLERQENDWMPVKTSRMIRPEELTTSENEKTNNNEGLQLANDNLPSLKFEECDKPELFNKTNNAPSQAHKAQKRKLEALTFAINAPCNGIRAAPSVIQGNAVTTVTALPTFNTNIGLGCPVQTTQMTPLVTEIVPSLQLGDITVGGDIPIGGSIKVSGCFPVYGLVSVDGAVPSAGTAVINAGGGLLAQVIEPGCRVF